ncbi:MAG: hypothetical protein NTW74_02515 [Acidobacteria bacterium]|nr:hypothetical protein [Acidobacteriota bacterium]
MKKSLKNLTILLICAVSSKGAYAQEPISLCENFVELLRAPGIKLTASAQRPVLLPKEGLEPIVYIKNNTNKILEVPQIDSNSGVSVLHGHIDFSEDLRQSKAKRRCSFPTVDLQPGEERSFALSYPSPAWSESLSGSSDTYGRAALEKSGKHVFSVYVGEIDILGSYEVHDVQHVKSSCIDRSWRISKAQKELNLDSSQPAKRTCIMVSLVQQDQRWYLFAGHDVEYTWWIQSSSEKIQRGNQRRADGDLRPDLLPFFGIVIAEFDSEPVLVSPRVPAITKQEDFLVIDKNSRITIKSLSEAYQSKLRSVLP